MIARRLRRLAQAPVILLMTGACVATRQDMRVLQQDLQTVRAEVARADSLRAAQFAGSTAQQAQALRAVADSMRLLSARVNRDAADSRETLYKIEQQLLVIQELAGQTQRRIQEFKAEIESRSERARQPGTPGDTAAGAPPGGGAAQGPGPNQLLDLALAQLRRGSPASARAGFQEILQRHGTSNVADLAQFHLGEAYQAEGNLAQADSAFVTTYTKYPESPKAATAMYKHALILQQQGKAQQARTSLEEVVRKYPRSDEAELARGRLRSR